MQAADRLQLWTDAPAALWSAGVHDDRDIAAAAAADDFEQPPIVTDADSDVPDYEATEDADDGASSAWPAPPKRAWNSMRSGWGKRDALVEMRPSTGPAKRRWNSLNGAFGMRSPASGDSDDSDDSAADAADGGHADRHIDAGSDSDSDSGERSQRSFDVGGAFEANGGPNVKRGWRQLNGAYGKRVGECGRSMV